MAGYKPTIKHYELVRVTIKTLNITLYAALSNYFILELHTPSTARV